MPVQGNQPKKQAGRPAPKPSPRPSRGSGGSGTAKFPRGIPIGAPGTGAYKAPTKKIPGLYTGPSSTAGATRGSRGAVIRQTKREGISPWIPGGIPLTNMNKRGKMLVEYATPVAGSKPRAVRNPYAFTGPKAPSPMAGKTRFTSGRSEATGSAFKLPRPIPGGYKAKAAGKAEAKWVWGGVKAGAIPGPGAPASGVGTPKTRRRKPR